MSIRSASFSCVSPASLRYLRIPSPKSFRSFFVTTIGHKPISGQANRTDSISYHFTLAFRRKKFRKTAGMNQKSTVTKRRPSRESGCGGFETVNLPRIYLMPPTRSFSSKDMALAIFNKASTETVRCPFSKREMKTTDKPAFSANFSWVIFTRLRCVRMASPKMRRCIGTEGTSNRNRRQWKTTFTIV